MTDPISMSDMTESDIGVMDVWRVTRFHDDELIVTGEHGEMVVHIPPYRLAGPNGYMRPKSASDAASKPWWFTGSPFCREIYGEVWLRHAERNLKKDLVKVK